MAAEDAGWELGVVGKDADVLQAGWVWEEVENEEEVEKVWEEAVSAAEV